MLYGNLFRIDVFRCAYTALGKPTVSLFSCLRLECKLQLRICAKEWITPYRVLLLESNFNGVLQEVKLGAQEAWSNYDI